MKFLCKKQIFQQNHCLLAGLEDEEHLDALVPHRDVLLVGAVVGELRLQGDAVRRDGGVPQSARAAVWCRG